MIVAEVLLVVVMTGGIDFVAGRGAPTAQGSNLATRHRSRERKHMARFPPPRPLVSLARGC